MKISLEWLRRYLPLERAPEDIEEALTLIGFEVEGVERSGLPQLERVVVGEILSSEQHPNADRLTVCEVTTGKEGRTHTIVCGAKNYSVGDRVPVALVGAVLPGNLKIKKSKLRGVVSKGMMCSAKELRLGEDYAGLLILENRPEIGIPINEVFPEGDVIFDIEVTPNRPDCLSHIGIARELAAYLGLQYRYPEISTSPLSDSGPPPQELLKGVIVECPENCPHYRGYSIKGVNVAPSPDWLQRLIIAVGLRPINNVVDVTNFVLYETGQPLHAFDAAKIGGSTIIVRQARESEEITTLDEKERELNARMTVIADSEKPMVVAGVMGSVDAEVNEETKNIVLESAYFNPRNIRWTSKQLGLSSDSSYRFERGVDPGGAERAALRAIDLIQETAGGSLIGPAHVAGEGPVEDRQIPIEPDFIRAQIGFDVEDEKIWEILESLELSPCEGGADLGSDGRMVRVPSFRVDLERPVDLVEEFLRIYGTDKVPAADVVAPAVLHDDDPVSLYRTKATDYLVSQHFSECVNFSLREASELRRWFPRNSLALLKLANALTEDQSHLRASLIPGLLDNLQLNRFRGNQPERLFETGSVFREHEGQTWELISAAFVMVQSPVRESWRKREEPDFYSVASLVDNLLYLAGVEGGKETYSPVEDGNCWQTGHAARLGEFWNGSEGCAGLLNLSMLREWDIEGTALAGAVYFLPSFFERSRSSKTFRSFSQYPAATKDLALVVDETINAESVRSNLEGISVKVAGERFGVEAVSIFDVYRGEGLPEHEKSLAFSITFRSDERTLTDVEVNEAFEEILAKIVDGTGYTLRN